MTLPGHPWIARRDDDGALCVDGVDLADLAREYGTPLYVYSRRAMLDALARYESAFAKRSHLVCYAMKANSNLAVVQTFVNAGCGIDIVSGGELERALAAGASPSKIVFSGVGKRDDELRRALEVGVRGFNVESVSELHALSRMAQATGKRARISLRVNPDIDAGTHPYISTGLKSNKFGIPHDQALEVYRLAWKLPRIEVAGIDCHIGSQITDVAPYLAAVDRVLDLVETIERSGIRLHHLDFGGGLGITYDDETPPAADELIAQAVKARDYGKAMRYSRQHLFASYDLVLHGPTAPDPQMTWVGMEGATPLGHVPAQMYAWARPQIAVPTLPCSRSGRVRASSKASAASNSCASLPNP